MMRRRAAAAASAQERPGSVPRDAHGLSTSLQGRPRALHVPKCHRAPPTRRWASIGPSGQLGGGFWNTPLVLVTHVLMYVNVKQLCYGDGRTLVETREGLLQLPTAGHSYLRVRGGVCSHHFFVSELNGPGGGKGE